jgi:regulator of cell morphogenesis and NO signaling
MESSERFRAPSELDRPNIPWWALDELCEHLVRNRHVALRDAVSALGNELTALAREHGTSVPLLIDASSTFEAIGATLLSHLAKEENILFPAFAALAMAWREGRSAPRLPFPTVRHPISLMEAEHDRLEQSFARLHEITATLTFPDQRSERWAAWNRALGRFEDELRADTHVEDDVLFPRALELERALL